MPGVWRVTKLGPASPTTIQYKDFETGREWEAGAAPPEFPVAATWGWLLDQVGPADVILWNGAPFVCHFASDVYNLNETPH